MMCSWTLTSSDMSINFTTVGQLVLEIQRFELHTFWYFEKEEKKKRRKKKNGCIKNLQNNSGRQDIFNCTRYWKHRRYQMNHSGIFR